MWQGYRDSMQYAYQAGENDLDRENRLAIAKIQENATIKAAQAQRTANAVSSLGQLGAAILGKTLAGDALGNAASSFFKGLFGDKSSNYDWNKVDWTTAFEKMDWSKLPENMDDITDESLDALFGLPPGG